MINVSPREISANLISARSTSARLVHNPVTSSISLIEDSPYKTTKLQRNPVISSVPLTFDHSYIVTTLGSTVIITRIYSLNFTKTYNSMYLGFYL